MATLWAGAAWADGLPSGCFARDYSAAHLAANPQQNVAAIRLNFRVDPEYGGDIVEVIVRLADQGRAAKEGMGGQTLDQIGICWDDAEMGPMCAVECDAGQMRIGPLSGDALDVTTSHFWVGDVDDCGGSFDLAEGQGEATIYRLTRAAPDQCEGL